MIRYGQGYSQAMNHHYIDDSEASEAVNVTKKWFLRLIHVLCFYVCALLYRLPWEPGLRMSIGSKANGAPEHYNFVQLLSITLNPTFDLALAHIR
jgi:hypothetical protein